MKKQILSGFLAALMMLTPAFAAADGAASSASETAAYQAVLADGYDISGLKDDLQTAAEVLRQRASLLGGEGIAAAAAEDTLELTGAADFSYLDIFLSNKGEAEVVDPSGDTVLTRADIAENGAAVSGTELTLTLTESGAAALAEVVSDLLQRQDGEAAVYLRADGKSLSRTGFSGEFTGAELAFSFESTAEAYQALVQAAVQPLPFSLVKADEADASASDTAGTETYAFPDLAGHWAEKNLSLGVELGLLKGIDGKLMPDSAVKRSEALTILNRALGAEKTASISSLPSSEQTAWYGEELAKAAYLGLVDTGDTRSFNNAASRAEAFVLIARAFVYGTAETESDALSAFTDTGSMTAEQKQAVAALISAGIINGATETTLAPSRTLTRAEFVTMITRVASAITDLDTAGSNSVLRASEYALGDTSLGGNLIFAPATDRVTLNGTEISGRIALKGADEVVFIAQNAAAVNTLAVDSVGEATLALTGSSTVKTLLIAGTGGKTVFDGAADQIEITSSGRKIELDGIEASSVVISGSGNTVTVSGTADAVTVGGKNNKVIIDRSVGSVVVSGIGSEVSGDGRAKSVEIRAEPCKVTLSADTTTENIDSGLDGVEIVMTVPAKVTAGGSLLTKVSFTGVSGEKICSAQWYEDDKALSGYSNSSFRLNAAASSSHTSAFTFTKDMKTSVTVGFKLTYENPSTGKTEEKYAQKTVPIENYSDEWYAQRDKNRILNLVSSTYKGNYTTSYAVNNDYKTYEKEVWVNAKGYSSKSKYLVWVNRAYQHANVFEGSKGNWKLVKSFLVGTGAASSPTPTGVTTITYKLAAGWTTKTYTVRPVVGFYPNSGYAFHSRLCSPGTDTEYDFSAGYPISHGCVRMYKSDVNWIYNNVPIGSTVVIF